MAELMTDATRGIVAGALVDAALFAITAGGAAVFVATGDAWSLLGSIMVGHSWATDVGNYPGKPRF